MDLGPEARKLPALVAPHEVRRLKALGAMKGFHEVRVRIEVRHHAAVEILAREQGRDERTDGNIENAAIHHIADGDLPGGRKAQKLNAEQADARVVVFPFWIGAPGVDDIIVWC